VTSHETVVGPPLILFGFGVLGAVLGYVLGFLVAGVIGVIALYLVFLRHLAKPQTNKRPPSKAIKTMLKCGVPLSISSIPGFGSNNPPTYDHSNSPDVDGKLLLSWKPTN
jgi:O-antigen/teichoic acid export membrane protein